MSSGFAIWRKPGESPVGIKGEFQETDIQRLNLQQGFVFRPWNTNATCFWLQGDFVCDISEFQSWTITVQTLSDTNIQVMSREDWGNYISAIQQKIALDRVRKVVAARQTLCQTGVSLYDAFNKACERYQDAFVSLVYHPQFGVWLGATPEILIQPDGDVWETVSMAGTLMSEDGIWTGKEQEENLATQQFLEQILAEMGARVLESAPADVVRAGSLRHLVRRYRFLLHSGEIQRLISQLHPTPAVGGLPREAALSVIEAHEKESRGLFAGFLGFYRHGKPHLWVNLRCCEWRGADAVLHAGAGINALSDAASEWEETGAKMQTIGSCL